MKERQPSHQDSESVIQQDYAAVARLQAGDDDAFEEIMSRYKKPVLNFIYRMIDDPVEAEDIAQIVFVRIYQRIGSFKPRGKFSSWVFDIAHNAAIDHLRWRKRHHTEDLEHENNPSWTAAIAPDNVVKQASAHEVGELVGAAVQQLPRDQKEVLILSQYHGHSYAEIAKMLRCSKKSVELRLYRARLALREYLGPLMEDQMHSS